MRSPSPCFSPHGRHEWGGGTPATRCSPLPASGSAAARPRTGTTATLPERTRISQLAWVLFQHRCHLALHLFLERCRLGAWLDRGSLSRLPARRGAVEMGFRERSARGNIKSSRSCFATTLKNGGETVRYNQPQQLRRGSSSVRVLLPGRERNCDGRAAIPSTKPLSHPADTEGARFVFSFQYSRSMRYVASCDLCWTRQPSASSLQTATTTQLVRMAVSFCPPGSR